MFPSIVVWLIRNTHGSTPIRSIVTRLTRRDPVSTQASRAATRKMAMPQSTEGSRTVAEVRGRKSVRGATM